MKVTTTIDKKHNIRKHKVIGAISKKFLLKELDEIYLNPALEHMDTFWDFSNADLTSFTIEDVEEVAGFVKRHWPSSRQQKSSLVAPDVSTNLIARKYAKQFEGLESSRVKVFTEREEALSWLGGVEGDFDIFFGSSMDQA